MKLLRKIIDPLFPTDSPLRLLYHKISAILATIIYGNPSKKLTVIGVTGTSGKSTTVELLHFILQGAGVNTASIGGIRVWMGTKWRKNPSKTLRTGLRPWTTQKLLKECTEKNITHAIVEVSSHALHQHRVDGIAFDCAMITNLANNEHLDYHHTVEEYRNTKGILFQMLNTSFRKKDTPKVSVLNADDPEFAYFKDFSSDKQWTYGIRRPADVMAENVVYHADKTEFTLRIPNANARVTVPLTGQHNVMNILAATTVALSVGVNLPTIVELLPLIPPVPGRMERITPDNHPYTVVVDHSYKPAALAATLEKLRDTAHENNGQLTIIWGPTGNRGDGKFARDQRQECADLLHKYADTIVLATDDPGTDDNNKLLSMVREMIPREEGQGFWRIDDRYEAIRYGVYTAQAGDMVLVAGRGHEATQWINGEMIAFDDRAVARQVLSGLNQE